MSRRLAALIGGALLLAGCASTPAASRGAATRSNPPKIRVSTTTTTANAGSDPTLVEDAQNVAADLSSLSSDQNSLDQLTETVMTESKVSSG